MLLDELAVPVVLAPLAGGPSTPELAAAVTQAGGLGFLASGYLSADELAARIRRLRELTPGPLAVNLFVPEAGPTPPSVYEPFLTRLTAWAQAAGVELGKPTYSDDDWEAKLELLRQQPAEVVSFTFGCPASEVMRQLRAVGSECWVTVTNAQEARLAAEAGADGLIAQGAEAGGHRASFVDRPDVPVISLLPLLALIRDTVELPVIASGGLATGAGVAAVLAAGAAAAQVGTAFMLAPEAGTAAAHREALRGDEPTVLTRAFTGRLARGIRNQFTAAHSDGAPLAYPEVHYVTVPMRRQARVDGNPELINLWAGEAHQLAVELPGAEIVRRLAADAEVAGP
ncbi:MAG: nitronate monooxygenase [Solirubrobacteraceae bacterium]